MCWKSVGDKDGEVGDEGSVGLELVIVDVELSGLVGE